MITFFSISFFRGLIKSNMPMPEIDAFAASNGGLANLTRTVAPPRGPQHMGLASFKKRGR